MKVDFNLKDFSLNLGLGLLCALAVTGAGAIVIGIVQGIPFLASPAIGSFTGAVGYAIMKALNIEL